MKKLLSLVTAFLLILVLACPVNVQAATVKLSKAKATMEVDSTLKLMLGTIDAAKVSWKSNNTKIVTVAKTGTITAKKEGTATITATYQSKKYTCDVTVVDSNKAVPKKDYYSLGETWTVDGQWRFTFDSVTTTSDRNKYSDMNPEQVIILKYTYENLGYEGKFQDLYISSTSMQVIDGKSEMASTYPASTSVSPDTTPVGAKCVGAEVAFGLNNESDTITVYLTEYDGNYTKHKAKFILKVD